MDTKLGHLKQEQVQGLRALVCAELVRIFYVVWRLVFLGAVGWPHETRRFCLLWLKSLVLLERVTAQENFYMAIAIIGAEIPLFVLN
jgi:hypothetical protein